MLALGADLKNTITLVVDGQAFVSQHIGDLEHSAAFAAFRETIADLLRMYDVRRSDLVVVRDSHPQYRSSQWDPAAWSVQHHRAHVASVLAERAAWDTPVLGVALDGTGYGDDGTIWGGEIFAGSVADGFTRVAHLRPAPLPGGDAAAQHPEQAAAGFLEDLSDVPNLEAPPFGFSARYRNAVKLCRTRMRTFTTTSAGRLFDTAAALLGFTRPVTFEGQAAIWLEQNARRSGTTAAYEWRDLDYRSLLQAVIRDRMRGRPVEDIARAFHAGFARGLGDSIVALCTQHGVHTVVASGGVLQNELLVQDLSSQLDAAKLAFWTNHSVPSNDGGISLGQAALAAFGQMHELSVALSIIDLAQEEGERIGGRVCAVHVRVGALAGVVKEALVFSYDIACQDTALEGSRLVINEVPVRVFCPTCGVIESFSLPACCVAPSAGRRRPMSGMAAVFELVALEIEE